jgi:hypothetical protein
MGAVVPVLKVVTGLLTAGAAVKTVLDKPEAPPQVVEPTPKIEEPVTEEKKPITEAPEVAEDIAKEEEKKRRRKRRQTRTLLTGARGVLAPAEVQKKTLLGE